MRKLDEIALYAALRYERSNSVEVPVDVICADLGIPLKRGIGLLEKWYGKGWVECGVNIRWCWFTADAPAALLPWGVVA